MHDWWFVLAGGVIALSLGVATCVRLVALKFGVVDEPDGQRKRHTERVPLLGGVSIYAVFLFVMWAIELRTGFFTTGMISRGELLGVTIGATVLLVHGIIDDWRALAPKYSVIATVIGSLAVVIGGVEVAKITNPFGGQLELAGIVSDILVFLWIMVVIYSMKLLDGLDGLVSGLGVIASFVMAFLALTTAYYQPDVALLAMLFGATMIGFLALNYPPAKMFLGESGSVLVGFFLAVFAVIGGSKVATALLVVGLPAMDMLAVIWQRLRLGKRVSSGDRLHLHFQLMEKGHSPEMIVIGYWLIALAFGLSTLIFESWQKVVALGILFVLTIFLIRYATHRNTYQR